MEIFLLPATYVALGTLVLLEVVLGIDNLIFIAILSEKLPPVERDKARIVGLGFALLMRLCLLSVISWIATLTTHLGTFLGHDFSWRDIILLLGGLFLLFKGTRELHERLESAPHTLGSSRHYARFWVVVLQIVVLDAVFSLDAVVTAVGIAEHLPVMMIAVSVAMGIMLLAAKPLTHFVNRHPTVVVLCLSFLLLIGLSLIAESLGFAMPKGYLYAAIGFSVLIEFFNQVAQRNIRKHEKRKPMRVRTAEAVLRLLGGDQQLQLQPVNGTLEAMVPDENSPIGTHPFGSEEVDMVGRILTLSDRTVRSIMTHRGEAEFMDLDLPAETLIQQLLERSPSVLPVCRGSLDNIIGVAYSAELFRELSSTGAIDEKRLEEPLILPESMRVIKALDTLRKSKLHLALIADEYGSIEGLVTLMDIFEAITGDIHEEGEVQTIRQVSKDRWLIAGSADVHHLELVLGLDDLASESNDYTSLGGFMLDQLGRLPEVGDSVVFSGYRFTVREVAERRISLVDVELLPERV